MVSGCMSATQVCDELTPKYFKSIEQFSVGVVWSGHTQKFSMWRSIVKYEAD